MALAMLAPAFVLLGVWTYAPLLEALWLSFHEWNLLPTMPPAYVGLDNYARLLELRELHRAAWNTVIYTLGLLPLTVALPLVVALLAGGVGGWLGDLYRALIFVPMVIAPIVVAIVWRWLLNPSHGVVNALITGLGFPPVAFLQDPSIAIWSIIFITGWKLIGFSAIIFSAAIADVDRGLMEAARLDGASEFQIARHVIVPLIRPALLLVTMLTLLHGAQWSFVYINVLTQGGPLLATTNLYYLLWDYGFGNFAIGWATAAGMLLLAVYAVVAAACLYVMRRHAAPVE